jgi:hypothetical protein
MHYVTRRSHQMQKPKFGAMYPGLFFVESITVPPEHEKYCVNFSQPGHIGMHYVTCRSHQMQKHKFGVTSPSALTFCTLDVAECTT